MGRGRRQAIRFQTRSSRRSSPRGRFGHDVRPATRRAARSPWATRKGRRDALRSRPGWLEESRAMTNRSLGAIVLSVVLLAGCSGATSSAPSASSAGAAASAAPAASSLPALDTQMAGPTVIDVPVDVVSTSVVNTAGASIAADGVTVAVPARGVTGDTSVVVSRLNAPFHMNVFAPSAPTDVSAIPIGHPYDFGPAGVSFIQPVEVTVPYDPQYVPAGADPGRIIVSYFNGTSWVAAGGIVDPVAHTVTVRLTEFAGSVLVTTLVATAVGIGVNRLIHWYYGGEGTRSDPISEKQAAKWIAPSDPHRHVVHQGRQGQAAAELAPDPVVRPHRQQAHLPARAVQRIHERDVGRRAGQRRRRGHPGHDDRRGEGLLGESRLDGQPRVATDVSCGRSWRASPWATRRSRFVRTARSSCSPRPLPSCSRRAARTASGYPGGPLWPASRSRSSPGSSEPACSTSRSTGAHTRRRPGGSSRSSSAGSRSMAVLPRACSWPPSWRARGVSRSGRWPTPPSPPWPQASSSCESGASSTAAVEGRRPTYPGVSPSLPGVRASTCRSWRARAPSMSPTCPGPPTRPSCTSSERPSRAPPLRYGFGDAARCRACRRSRSRPVSYTHLTLPTNREG